VTFDFGIVNYNGGAALSDCIASILALEGAPVRLFVFDNASTDGSPEEAERRFPHLTVIHSARNLGYAGALNRLLREMTAEVVVFCNMDLEFDPRWLHVVRAALRQHPEADAISCLVLEMTDPPVVNSTGIRFYADLHPQNLGSGQPYRPGTLRTGEVVAGYGAVMCFRRASIRDLCFDEDYFLFFEETDFYLRFRLLGRRTLFVPDALVYHQRSLTTRRYSPLKLYYGERNRVTTIFKLLPIWYWPVTFAYSLRRFATLRKQTTGAQEKAGEAFPGAGAIIRTILHAWGAAVLRLPSTLRKRRAFWGSTHSTPGDTLRLLKTYRLSRSDLTLR
jgi:GT2 family glycosyltransferase